MAPGEIPRWVDYLLVPLVNLAVALLLSGLVVIAIGANPIDALNSLLFGAVGYPEAIGFTLYYATNFIFTGLSVAVAFHAGLFNIGGEGQAYIGGLGVGLVCLALDQWPLVLVFPIAVAAAALFGAAWAFIPAYLQAKRGSHIVITTIMFNFIASALMTYLLVDVLVQPGQQAPRSRDFAPGVRLPCEGPHEGSASTSEPRSTLLPAGRAGLRARLALHLARVGAMAAHRRHSGRAARYAGISRTRAIVLAMLI